MEGPTDDFKGFGDGFEGFPKHLPEDCVEYSLYLINAKLNSPKERLSRLELVRKESVKLTERLLKEYIWQRDNFKLEVKSESGTMYLHGLTNYGDSVEDEWLIVYILKELSNQFPDLWIKVIDTDGEFLLIEAANALPRWLNPEIADNRVWINNSTLRIIPLIATPSPTSQKTTPISRSLTLPEALSILTKTPEILIHSPLLESEAFYRLQSYPSQITASLHHSLIPIPRKLAYIIHSRPASIAPAIEAFYLRDPISLKSLSPTNPKTLIFPPEDLVTVSVKFTKILFAQLKSQQFTPPPSWIPILTSPPPNLTTTPSQLELGMKLTSSYEMLLSPTNPSPASQSPTIKRSIQELRILLEDLDTDPLPTDLEISLWLNIQKSDSEKWMDIDFSSFEQELSGGSKTKPTQNPGMFGPEPPPGISGFGDKKTQEDLKKMVQRFEKFLNDDEAGVEGAEWDEMDEDDDEDEYEGEEGSEGESDGEEDKEVSFDEKEFARMMREMMGMPSEEEDFRSSVKNAGTKNISGMNDGSRIEELDSEDEEEEEEGVDEAAEIRKVMQQMEVELNEAGVLNLEPTLDKISKLREKQVGKKRGGEESDDAEENDEEDSDEDGEVYIDFNLARNLLESFKSQGGLAGPGGNMLGMLGLRLPRDEGEDGEGSRNKEA